MVLVSAGDALGQGVEINERVPFEVVGETPLCGGGEEIIVRGTIHTVLNITEDRDGGFHFVGHTNYQEAEAVGVQTGEHFVITLGGASAINEWVGDPSKMEFTTATTGVLVRQGEDGTHMDDTLVHMTFHFTQNANGEVTAEVEQFDLRCN